MKLSPTLKGICFLLLFAAALHYATDNSRSTVDAPKSDANGHETNTLAEKIWSDTIETSNPHQSELTYHVYRPALQADARPWTLVLLGGFNADGRRFMKAPYTRFASEHGYIIVAPSFKSSHQNFRDRVSYQFPQAWSGRALHAILDRLAASEPIDRDHIMVFGFSAGAQFAHRFALLYPSSCVASASHAAGGYTAPETFTQTQFLVTVGSKDSESRKKWARIFTDAADALGISVQHEIINGAGHNLTPSQIRMSFDFFTKARGRR